jgi:hypothetical protein
MWYKKFRRYIDMATIAFDTLKFVEKLEKAGVSREQAAAFADAQKEAFAEALDTTLATKIDIEAILTELVLVKWMLGVVIAISVANFAKQFF